MAAGLDLHSIRAVVFDAVGTLIAPEPPPAQVYASVARNHGVQIAIETVRERFWAAFEHEEKADQAAGWRTDAEREVDRWRKIVTLTLPEVADRASCFQALWDHFADPGSWRVLPVARQWIEAVATHGLPIGVASNFDGRLRNVLAGRPELPRDLRLMISSEVGWRKPAPQFFTAVADAMACPPKQILLIGDDRANDIEPARAAGMQTLLVNVYCRYGFFCR